MKLKGRWIVQLLIAILVVIVGIFILARQDLFIQVFIIVLGIVAIITGIGSLATMNRYSFGRFNHATTLVKGVLGIIIGVLAVIMPLATGEAMWTIIIYVLAAQMVISAIVMIIDAFAVHAAGFPAAPLVTEGLVSLVFAVMLFLFPRSVADLLVIILGITVIVVGLTLALVAFMARKKRTGVTVEAADVEIDETP